MNTREHRITRRAPAVMLVEERERLHPLAKVPHTLCFGQTRRVSWQSTISLAGALYSVPSTLIDERVWARVDGSELVVVHADDPNGPREVARHELTTPGRPAISGEHYPPRPPGALERRPRARSRQEAAFLALGPGAEAWLSAAAAAGSGRVRRKMAEAVDLAKLHGEREVDHALAICAEAARFGDGDLAAILAHEAHTVIAFPKRISEEQTLQRSTQAWERDFHNVYGPGSMPYKKAAAPVHQTNGKPGPRRHHTASPHFRGPPDATQRSWATPGKEHPYSEFSFRYLSAVTPQPPCADRAELFGADLIVSVSSSLNGSLRKRIISPSLAPSFAVGVDCCPPPG